MDYHEAGPLMSDTEDFVDVKVTLRWRYNRTRIIDKLTYESEMALNTNNYYYKFGFAAMNPCGMF